jgi:Family of unknown function (DUF6090)
MNENKTGRYLLYAVGEIALVVIGILIALNFNNANENRKRDQRETILLKELISNLETNIINLESDIKLQKESLISLDYVLNHMDNKKPFNDSIPGILANADYAPDVILTSSSYETLKSSGLELIKSDTLRQEIIHLFEVTYPTLMQETKRLEDQLWPAVVVPLFQKHFRHVTAGWLPINYDAWLNDQEFINMYSFRRYLRNWSTEYKMKTVATTHGVIALIQQALDKGDIN